MTSDQILAVGMAWERGYLAIAYFDEFPEVLSSCKPNIPVLAGAGVD